MATTRFLAPILLMAVAGAASAQEAMVPQQTPIPQPPGVATAPAAPDGEAGGVMEIVLPGTCTLSYKGRIYSQGPCEGVLINHHITEVTGTIPGEGYAYRAVINEFDQTGVLLGAEFFVLGDGPFEHSPVGGRYLWQTGYALDAVFTVEE